MSATSGAPSAGSVGRRRMTADIAAQLVGRAINLGLGVIVTVALVRYLGESKYGEWATLLSIVALITAAGPLALPRVVVPKAAADPENERAWFSALIEIQGIIAIPAAILSVVIVVIISRGNEMLVAGFVLSTLLLLNAPSALGTVFQMRVRNDIGTLLGIANSIVWTAGVLIIRSADAGLVAIAIMFVGAAIFTAVVTIALSVRFMRFDWVAGHALRSTVVRIAIPIAVFGLAVTAYNAIDTIIVFELSGSRDAGLYGSVYRILDQAGVFPAAIVTTLTPIVASSYKTDLPRTHKLVQAAADMLAILSFGGVALALSAGGPLLELLYGEAFRVAAPSLTILMVAFVLIGLGYVYGTLVVVLGIQRRVLKYALLALAVNVSLNLIFVPIFGYTAAAVITVITEALVLTLTVRVVAPILQFKMKLTNMIRTGFAAAGMCLIVWGLRLAGAEVGWLLAASVVSYGVLLFALKAIDRRELVSLVVEKPAA
ncbi:MAG TPA: polysaccharide biosynthesis C-terminal domain-containing protein [Thermoleophilaceae bacterium]|jgi:O-antigen/teichoic acid export membrane protein